MPGLFCLQSYMRCVQLLQQLHNHLHLLEIAPGWLLNITLTLALLLQGCKALCVHGAGAAVTCCRKQDKSAPSQLLTIHLSSACKQQDTYCMPWLQQLPALLHLLQVHTLGCLLTPDSCRPAEVRTLCAAAAAAAQ